LQTILKYHKNYENIFDMTIVYDTMPKENYGISYSLSSFINKNKFPSRVFINLTKYKINKEIQDLLEKIYLDKDDFVDKFNPNVNKFKKINYNYYNGLISFIYFFILNMISYYLFFKYPFVRSYYLCEFISYMLYMLFVY
jgi:hypothetical protein